MPGRASQSGLRVHQAGVPQGLTIVIAAFLPIMAIVSLAPAIPGMMAHFSGLQDAATFIPLIVTVPGLVVALASPAMGWLADRYGRRPICLAATLSYAILGLSPLFMSSLPAIFASRLGLGLCEAGILTTMNTLLGDYFEPARRSFWLTVQGFLGTIFATTLIIISGMATAIIWNGAFILYGLAIPIFLAMLVFIFEPERHSTIELQTGSAAFRPFPWTEVLAFSAVTLFAAILFYVGVVQVGLAFAAVGVTSPKALGVMISVASIGVPLGSLLFGGLAQRLRIARLLLIVFSLFTLGLVGMGLARAPQVELVFAFIQQIGAGMCVPVLVLWATKALDVEHRGRGIGVWSSAFFLGQFLSPIAVGIVRGLTGGLLSTLVIMGLLALVGTLGALLGERWAPRD